MRTSKPLKAQKNVFLNGGTLRRTATVFILILGLSALMQLVHAVEPLTTIIIRPDGSIDPPMAPIQRDGAVYAFIGEIYAEIIVQKNNTIIDGRNFALKGSYVLDSTGILLSNVKDVEVKNVHIIGFFYAIKIKGSKNCAIIKNNITANNFGVWVEHSAENIITKNVFSNLWCGVALKYSSKNQISENLFSNNQHGVMLDWSNENVLTKNVLMDNGNGIILAWSDNNLIDENAIASKTKRNWHGIELHSSSSNTIYKNTVENTVYAIWFYDASKNLVVLNNVSRNTHGIIIWYATNNTIYHNRFIDNMEQAKCYPLQTFPNKWDNGYPSGGNYWSDYTGADEKSGRNQDQPGSDGIGDTPYIIDNKNVDYYPLVSVPLKQKSDQMPIVFYALTIAILTGLGTLFFILHRTRIAKNKAKVNVLLLV